MVEFVTLGRYIFERLKELGVLTIFGLPGDFNMTLLDKVYEVDGMRWAGNTNELNAAYAADGYSRVKGLACLVTTFGVGELSALNGIAGAFAEHVGLLHIVGIPSISSQAKQLLLHHTLGNGDFTVFHRMSSNISQTTVFLSDIRSAPAQIDRCIRDAFIYQRPVYIGLPLNLVDMNVPRRLLNTPVDLTLVKNDPDAQEDAVEEILQLISQARNPIILVDACASRHHCKQEVSDLANKTQFPVLTTPMGKSCLNESHDRFAGVYIGSLSNYKVKELADSADLVLSIGALLSDFNTGSFSYSYKTKNVVEFHSDCIKIKQGIYPGIQMNETLRIIIDRVHEVTGDYIPTNLPDDTLFARPQLNSSSLTQEFLWSRVGTWFENGDIIVSETGTAAFGIILTKFPDNAIGISQVLWGSVGFALCATLGASMAADEIKSKRRVILFVGDGSLQLTVQEISTMIKWNLTPYIFVLNNEGYTIDRLIHGLNATYNDIQPWNILALLPIFNARNYETYKISSSEELDLLLSDYSFSIDSKIRMIEIMLPRLDAPTNLIQQIEYQSKMISDA